MIALVAQHYAPSPFTNLRCKLLFRHAHRRPPLSGIRGSGIPEPVKVKGGYPHQESTKNSNTNALWRMLINWQVEF